jgi:predicted lysophospholipase L1 biosynthesis ABC-type transport system permease subunit
VANQEYLEAETGQVWLCDIWLRLEPRADVDKVLQGVRRLGVLPSVVGDLGAGLQREAGRLERAGMYGLLTISYVAGLLLAGLGLLVHSMASIERLKLRVAVWQAIGLYRGQVLRIVSVQYALLVGHGLVSGVAIGLAALYLYAPLYRLIQGAGEPVPPFLPLVDWPSTVVVAAGMGLCLLGIQASVTVGIARSRMSEALRTGPRD